MSIEDNPGKSDHIIAGATIAGRIAGSLNQVSDNMKRLLQDPRTPPEVVNAFMDGVIAARYPEGAEE